MTLFKSHLNKSIILFLDYALITYENVIQSLSSYTWYGFHFHDAEGLTFLDVDADDACELI